MTVEPVDWQGWPAFALRDEAVEVVVVPERGAKLVSLRGLPTGRQWLWQDATRPVRPALLGDDYATHDISGFDECFPTIGACRYPGEGPQLADHGELWSRPWRVESTLESTVDAVTTAVDGVALPYTFHRTVSLPAPGTVRLDYRIRNHGRTGFAWLWSAHPLLAAEPGMRVELPGEPSLTKEFGLSNRIGPDDDTGLRGHLSRHVWPYVRGADGRLNDLRRLDFPQPPVTDKVVARVLDEGWAALAVPASGERLTIRFDPVTLPFLGVCVNLGAWPATGEPGRWVAIEPSTGSTDRLDEAHARGECGWLEPGATRSWHLELVLSGWAERP
jgi:galactose mutarotase-like enzyme